MRQSGWSKEHISKELGPADEMQRTVEELMKERAKGNLGRTPTIASDDQGVVRQERTNVSRDDYLLADKTRRQDRRIRHPQMWERKSEGCETSRPLQLPYPVPAHSQLSYQPFRLPVCSTCISVSDEPTINVVWSVNGVKAS